MAEVCTVIGVGPGLGKALVERFGREGYRVNMIARNWERLQQIEEELAVQNIGVRSYLADIADASSFQKALGESVADEGAPDAVIYNAAVLQMGDLLSYDTEDYARDYRVNVVGAIEAAQQLAPAMRERGGGKFILAGGGLAHQPQQGAASLSLGKIGVLAVAQMLQQAFADGPLSAATVTVNGAIEPGTRFSPEKIADFYWSVFEDRTNGVDFIYE